MVNAQVGRPVSSSWTFRIYGAIPAEPAWVGVGIGVGLLAIYFGVEYLAGQLPDAIAGRAPAHIYRDIRTATIVILGLAYLPTAQIYWTRATRRHLRELSPRLDAEGRALAGAERNPSGSHAFALAGTLGMYAFLLTTISSGPAPVVSANDYWILEHMWHWLLIGPMGWMMGQLAHMMVTDSQRFRRLATTLESVDLLDATAFGPFVRQGLVGVLIWVIFISVSMGLLIDLDFFGSPLAVMVPVVLAVAISALLLPVQGARLRIRDEKRATLARLREAIRADEGDLLAGATETSAARAARLTGLLAYEARIERVHEWPFDTTSLLRFALYVTLGVSSWIGGALVERVLDTALS